MKSWAGRGSRTFVCLVVIWGIGVAAASAAPPQACALAPASAIAHDLGMTQVVAHELAQSGGTSRGVLWPVGESPGGLQSECLIIAWKGARSKARIPNGTITDVTIETGEEDAGSPVGPEWAKSGASDLLGSRESAFQNMVEEAEGYVKERHVGPELWDYERADHPGFDLSGYDELSERGREAHGKRDLYVTWRPAHLADRFVSLNLVIDERKHAFAELNRIAEAVVPAFALTPGEFGTPGPPSPEAPERHFQRYKPCPSKDAVIEGSSWHLEHFEVIAMSCATAVAVERQAGRTGRAPAGWTLSEPGTDVEAGRKGRSRFLCYNTAVAD